MALSNALRMFGLLVPALAATPDADHAAVRDTIISAMNDFPSAPAKFLALMDDDAAYCSPYPTCQHGRANISTFLQRMPPGTNAIMLAEPMVAVSTVGGFMSTVSFSWPGTSEDCLYTADQHVQWNLSSSNVGQPKLNYVRWVFNASDFDAAMSRCLTPALKRDVHEISRDSELEAVRDYVISLQYSEASEALICDLLVPTARYCDPYPTSCALGRAGCRAMKGLPNDTSTAADSGKSAAASSQCRPSSARPLMPTGPATGAVYFAYSSAARNGSMLRHKLHHTWAIWDLAPARTEPSDSQQAPAPMLASFDWFMPSANV